MRKNIVKSIITIREGDKTVFDLELTQADSEDKMTRKYISAQPNNMYDEMLAPFLKSENVVVATDALREFQTNYKMAYSFDLCIYQEFPMTRVDGKEFKMIILPDDSVWLGDTYGKIIKSLHKERNFAERFKVVL